MKTLTLRIDNSGAHYAASGYWPWSATNLPVGAFHFRERETIFWEVKMLGYDAAAKALQLEVVDYEADPRGFQPNRAMKRPVLHLHFSLLDGEAFKAQLLYYQAGPLAPVLQPTEEQPLEQTIDDALVPPLEVGTSLPERAVAFTVPILDLTVVNGGVKGEATIPGWYEPLAFTIANDHLVAEFNTIKAFFVKALKRKTARVSATLVFLNEGAKLRAATSPEIARINEDMLELFRARSVRQLLGGNVKTVDKSLFTPEDIFASLDDNELGKAMLPQDGHDLLAEILKHKTVRNARQLEFLAGRLHQPTHKMRYVLSPKFGFVFLAEGQEGRHFILELLNSHATYVWSMPKDWATLRVQYRAVEKEIATIGALGRGQYRRSLHFEHDFWFIIHEAAESGVVDGFPRWKNRLLEGLI